MATIDWQDVPARPEQDAPPAWPHDSKPLLGCWEHAGQQIGRVIMWDPYLKAFVHLPGFHEAPVTKIARLPLPESA